MQISDKGLDFIRVHEGFVGKAYRCPAGVLTIGYGFTNGSKAVTRQLGTIKPGTVISREKAEQVLRSVINQEFGPAAQQALGPSAKQHHFDMAVSAAYNCGPRALRWGWMKLYREGKVAEAAARWAKTARTGGGVVLTGLVRRRKEEADLLENGRYAGTEPSLGFTAEVLREYQGKLKQLGFYKGPVDGLRGPQTTTAVRAFQTSDPHLDNDSILGRATMASIDRRVGVGASVKTGSGGLGIGLLGQGASYLQWIPEYVTYGLFAVAGVIGGYLLWKYRRAFEVKVRQVLGV